MKIPYYVIKYKNQFYIKYRYAEKKLILSMSDKIHEAHRFTTIKSLLNTVKNLSNKVGINPKNLEVYKVKEVLVQTEHYKIPNDFINNLL